MIIQPQIIGSSGGGTGNITADENFRFGYSTFTSIPQEILDFLDGRSGNFYNMFAYCKELTSIDDFADIDLSNVASLVSCFFGTSKITTVDLSGADFSSCTNFRYMFGTSGVTSLTFSGAKVNTNAAFSLQRLCQTCSKLITLTLDFVNNTMCEEISYICYGCTALTTLNFGTMDFTNVTSVGQAFNNCKELMTVTGTLTNIGAGFTANTTLNLSYCPLTNASAMVFINGLYDLVSAGSSLTHTINFSTITYGGLSAADIAVATAKGWTVTS